VNLLRASAESWVCAEYFFVEEAEDLGTVIVIKDLIRMVVLFLFLVVGTFNAYQRR
jgi:hypothetical protein